MQRIIFMRLALLGVSMVYLHVVSFGQQPFSWPAELHIDPVSYELKRMGIQEIVQYKTYGVNPNDRDSDKHRQTFLNYVLSYDEQSRISSLKYDFVSYYPYYHFAGDSSALDSLKSSAIQKNQPIYFVKLNGQWVAQLYWEVVFSYSNYGVSRLEIVNPYDRLHVQGVIDGVYVKNTLYQEVKIKNYYNEFGELVRTDTFSNDTLVRQDYYTYETFTRNGVTTRLLTEYFVDDTLYRMEYIFEE